MGIYDRDYYRREGGGFLASLSERGQMCKWIIAINVVLFFLQVATLSRQNGGSIGPVTEALQLDADKVMHGQVWRLITYAFLHDPSSLWHILFNMLFLWWFGADIEDLLGHREFLAFYLVSAFLGGIAFTIWVLADRSEVMPVCIGASGAVTAVMVLCAIHYPSRIILLFFFLPVPIWIFVLFNVAQDAFIFVSGTRTSTAVTVHLAGAGFAYLYQKGHWQLWGLWSGMRGWIRLRSRPRLRVYREEEPVHVSAPPKQKENDEQLDAKLDAVLEKIARQGQNSLSDSEREILSRASEAYKRKRT